MTDLGWTYTFNIGRIDLAHLFPNTTFVSISTPNVVAKSDKEKLALVLSYIASGCNAILSNDETLLGPRDVVDNITAVFQNVTFILLDNGRLVDFSHRNRLFVGHDYSAGYFLAGKAAGLQAASSQGCLAFVASWNNSKNPTDAWAGFILGVRSTNTNATVHLISQQSWSWVQSDDILVEQFVGEKNCTVMARYSNPHEMDLQLSMSNNRNVFSVGSDSEALQLFVGDSVLASVFVDWAKMYVPNLSARAARRLAQSISATRWRHRKRNPSDCLQQPFSKQ